MSRVAKTQIPSLETVVVEILGPSAVQFRGTLTSREPPQALSSFMRAVHAASLEDGLKELRVDVVGLTFVNSSAIRLFVDWATWVKDLAGTHYKLRFISSRHIAWQRASFMALDALAKDALAVEYID